MAFLWMKAPGYVEFGSHLDSIHPCFFLGISRESASRFREASIDNQIVVILKV